MSDKRTNEKRRGFLKGALVGSGAAIAAIATGTVAAAPEKKATPVPEPKPESQGYQETAHVRDYYKTAF
jgi:hypothetical protein